MTSSGQTNVAATTPAPKAQITSNVRSPLVDRNEQELQRKSYQRRRRRRRGTGGRGRMWGRDGGGAATKKTLTAAPAPARWGRPPAYRFPRFNLPSPSLPLPDPRLGRTALRLRRLGPGAPPYPPPLHGAVGGCSRVGRRPIASPAGHRRRLRAPGRPPRVRVRDLRRAVWALGLAALYL